MTPANTMASISSEVATGRKMNGRDGFILDRSGASQAGLQPPLLAGLLGLELLGLGLLGPPDDLLLPEDPLRDPAVGPACRAFASTSSTFAPSRSLSVPSTTTWLPGSSPLVTSVVSPSTAPALTFVTATLWSGLTRNTKVPGAPRCIAAEGTRVASCRVSTSMRTFTN